MKKRCKLSVLRFHIICLGWVMTYILPISLPLGHPKSSLCMAFTLPLGNRLKKQCHCCDCHTKTEAAANHVNERSEKSAMRIFSDDVDARIALSNQVPLDCVITSSESGANLIPVYTWQTLRRLATANSSSNGEREDFAKTFGQAGGFIVVEFDQDDDSVMTNSVLGEFRGISDGKTLFSRSPSVTLSELWSTLHRFFSIVDKLGFASSLHHQSLPGPASKGGGDNRDCGYNYVQSWVDPNFCRVQPTILEDTIAFEKTIWSVDDEVKKKKAAKDWKAIMQQKARPTNGTMDTRTSVDICSAAQLSIVEENFLLMNEVSTTAALIGVSGAMNQDLNETRELLKRLSAFNSSDPFLGFAGSSGQRFARYLTPRLKEERTFDRYSPVEGLTGHTDWSFITAVPVSPTPGLHVWSHVDKQSRTRNKGRWIAPEQVLLQNSTRRVDGQNFEDCSKYCVLMAGKWMELLTKQQIPSCIHRVVSMDAVGHSLPSTIGRLSAPFFLRPTSNVAEQLRKHYDRVEGKSKIVEGKDAVSHAIKEIYTMFEDVLH